MNIKSEKLLKTEQFRKYVHSLQDPTPFLKKLDWAVNEGKVSQLEKNFPKDFTVDQLVASLLLNLQQDYDSIITDLPADFQAEESKRYIHIDNTNQIGIYYEGEIQKGKGKVNPRIACVSLHFRDIGDTQLMYIENVQGELKEKCGYSLRELRRVFGKLNSHFGEDWRVGLLRQPIRHARDRDMEVRGKVPGLFYFIGSSLSEYPIYSLNYAQTYLRSGIPLENIEFSPVPDESQTKWATAVDFLRTKNLEERLHLLDSAANEYTESYDRLCHQFLEEDTFGLSTFCTSNEREFARVFTKYLS